MGETLGYIFDIAVEIFVVCTMISLGLQVKLQQIIEPISRVSIIIKALLCNFILIPIAALVIAKLLGLDISITIGLVLVGLCAGAPMLAKYADFAKSDMAYAAALMVFLQIGTIVAVPLLLPIFPIDLGADNLELDVMSILKTLLLSMLLPIVVGMIIYHRYERLAKIIQPTFANLATIAMVILLTIGIFLAHKDLIGLLGSGAFIASVLLIGISLLIGYLAGGKDPAKRNSFMLACGSRNDTAAILIASQNMDDEKVLVMVLAFAIVMIIFNTLFSSELGRRQDIHSRNV